MFPWDYPFTPPNMKLLFTDDLEFKDSIQNVLSEIKILRKQNWSPVITLKSLIYLLELKILFPHDRLIKDFTYTDLYGEEIKTIYSQKIKMILFEENNNLTEKNIISSDIIEILKIHEPMFKKRKFSQFAKMSSSSNNVELDLQTRRFKNIRIKY
jgi:hypothetical protein